MGVENNPASDPMNGPNRLSLDRTPEARTYDANDWPGSSSFHPPHITELFRGMAESHEELDPSVDTQSELPFEE